MNTQNVSETNPSVNDMNTLLERRASAEGFTAASIISVLRTVARSADGSCHLYPGVRERVASALGVDLSPVFHKMFDQVVEQAYTVAYTYYEGESSDSLTRELKIALTEGDYRTLKSQLLDDPEITQVQCWHGKEPIYY